MISVRVMLEASAGEPAHARVREPAESNPPLVCALFDGATSEVLRRA